MRTFILTIGSLLCWWLALNHVQAQDRLDAVPAAPEAAALGKYADLPVSLSSGIAQADIPLVQISGKDLSLAINLGYHASGIRVADVAPWTGLGWSLKAQGVINRQVRGLPDDHPDNGWFAPSPWDASKTNGQFVQDYHYVATSDVNVQASGLSSGSYDLEPDLFSFQFPGGSGQFVLDHNKKVHFTTYQEGKIELRENAQGEFISFVYTSPEGLRYTFDQTVITQAPRRNLGNLTVYQYASSWYLSKIENVHRTDVIVFTYEDIQTEQTMYSTQLRYWENNLTIDGTNTDTYKVLYKAKRLVSIQSAKDKLLFVASAQEREDLPGDHALAAIQHYRMPANELIQHWELDYVYQGAGTAEYKRMYLHSLQKKGLNQASIPPYKFEYYSFPTNCSRVKGGRDWWGFCNGTATTGLPQTTLMVADKNSSNNRLLSKNVGEAVFEVNVDWTKAGSLHKITYPTGGYRVLEYEPQQYEKKHSFLVSEQPSQKQFKTPFTLKQWLLQTVGSQQVKWHPQRVSIFKEQAASTGIWEKEVSFEVVSSSLGKKVPVQVNATLSISEGSNSAASRVAIYAAGVTQPLLEFVSKGSHKQWLLLSAGRYTIKARIDQNDQSTFVEALAEVKVPIPDHRAKYGGGIRIAKIAEYAEDGGLPKVTNYQYYDPQHPNASSGTLLQLPVFVYLQPSGVAAPFCNGKQGRQVEAYCYRQISISNQNNFAGSASSAVHYQYVTVSNGFKKENGKVVYKYLPYAPQRNPEALGGSPQYFPFPMLGSVAWQTGLLDKKQVYNAENRLVLEENNQYQQVFLPAPVGYKVVFRSYPIYLDTDLVGYTNLFYKMGNENIVGYARLKKVITYKYDGDASNYSTHWQEMFYDDATYPLLLSRSTTRNSKNEVIENQTLYAKDLPSSAVKDAFVARHLLTQPIEQRSFLQKAGSKQLVSAQKTVFSVTPQQFLLPQSQWQVLLREPLSESAFLANPDSYYERKMNYLSYTDQGKLSSYQAEDNIPIVFMWDETNLYLNAKVENATLKTVYYQGFETAIDKSTDAKIGTHAWIGTFVDNVELLPGDYVMSYWEKTAAGWVFKQREFTHASGSYALSVSGHIDELRIYPKGAVMTTFSYLPNGRLHSINDLNGRNKQYTYDDLGRLKYLQDLQGNYLKRWDYQYLKD